MRMVALASLLLLSTTALAGCTGDDPVEPASNADEPTDGTYVGPATRLFIGSFTWGDNSQGPTVARLSVPVASIELPSNLTRIEVQLWRQHNGIERDGAHVHLELQNAGDASAMFAPRTHPFSGGGSLGIAAVATGATQAVIDYEYDVQPPGTVHNLEVEVFGWFPA